MTKISVIMPVYNTKESYLREAIESILSQTYTDFEFLIIDDASQTDIAKIVNSYKDTRIHFYRLPQNQGASGARNFALDRAQGEYIAIMDSDDIAIPTRFEKQLAYFNQHPEIGCLGGQVEVIGDDKKKLKFPQLDTNEQIEAVLTFIGCVFCHSTVMINRDILEKNKIHYNTKYIIAEDYALWINLIGKTQFAITNDNLLYYRYHFENITHREQNLLLPSTTEVQNYAIRKYCHLSSDYDLNILLKFLKNELLTEKEIQLLNQQIKFLLSKMSEKQTSAVLPIFQKRMKKQYYKTYSLSELLILSQSPLNDLLNISLVFRLFCIISRGLLSFKN